MKENKFKPNDRVAVYDTLEGNPIRRVGIVVAIERLPLRPPADFEYLVIDAGHGSFNANPKQCRKLIPKKKKPGDEIWLSDAITNSGSSRINGVPQQSYSWDAVTGWTKYKRCK